MGNFRVRICSAVAVLVIQAGAYAMPTLGRAECVLTAPETVQSIVAARGGRYSVVTQAAVLFPMLPIRTAMAAMSFICVSLVYSRRQRLVAIAGPLSLLVVTFQHVPDVCRHSVTAWARSVSRHEGVLRCALSVRLSEMEQASDVCECTAVVADIAGSSENRNHGQCLAVVLCNSVDEPITVTVPGLCGRGPPMG